MRRCGPIVRCGTTLFDHSGIRTRRDSPSHVRRPDIRQVPGAGRLRKPARVVFRVELAARCSSRIVTIVENSFLRCTRTSLSTPPSCGLPGVPPGACAISALPVAWVVRTTLAAKGFFVQGFAHRHLVFGAVVDVLNLCDPFTLSAADAVRPPLRKENARIRRSRWPTSTMTSPAQAVYVCAGVLEFVTSTLTMKSSPPLVTDPGLARSRRPRATAASLGAPR